MFASCFSAIIPINLKKMESGEAANTSSLIPV